jgi:SmpA / OmlA family
MRKQAILALFLFFACSLHAQNAASLSQFFEGKQVVVQLDMPASQTGVDIYPQRPTPIDLGSYQSRLKQYGTSLRNGDSVMITKIKVKPKSIEFQLGGGGYGTFWDDTDTSAHYTAAGKSQREKDLEDQLRSETDPDKRDQIKRELDRLRRDRERRDQQNELHAEQAAELKKQRVDSKRLQGGSRFNLIYAGKVPGDLTPEDVMAALGQYVSFSPQTFAGAAPEGAPAGHVQMMPVATTHETANPTSQLKKGMTEEQVQALLGSPLTRSEKEQNGMKMSSSTYKHSDSTVEADFVNGVLVKYSVAVN